MTRKLRLNPKICYVLGIFSCDLSGSGKPIGIKAKDTAIYERFLSIYVNDLGVQPSKIVVGEEAHGVYTAFFFNSKLRKLLQEVLDRRDKVFRWANAYSKSYLAGVFDSNGGIDKGGIFIIRLGAANDQVFENLGFHVTNRGGRSYLRNPNTFITFIGDDSLRAKSITRGPGNERDLR